NLLGLHAAQAQNARAGARHELSQLRAHAWIPHDAAAAGSPISAATVSRSSGAFSASVTVPLRSRLTSPDSVPAGGSSIVAVIFKTRSVAMQESQRTALVTCATSRCNISAPSV